MRTLEQLFIGGEWVDPSGDDVIEVVSPTTEEVVGRVPRPTVGDMDRAAAGARRAFDTGPWPRMTAVERAEVLERAAAGLQDRADELARVQTEQMGAPIAITQRSAVAPVAMLRYYLDLAPSLDEEDVRSSFMGDVLVRRAPVGVVAAVVPWNVPLFLTMTKVAPALVAGCTMVVKPAPETPFEAHILAEVLAEAGLPPGVMNVVAGGAEVGEPLVTHPGVDKVAFTGSTETGRRVMALCSQNLTRLSLELGGKSAAIILDDADLDDVIPRLLPLAMLYSGQACVAQTRILASRDRYQEVTDALSAAVGELTVGDPFEPETQIGPLASARQRARVEGYIRAGREEGATVTVGGGRPAGLDTGWYVEPTVFAGVDNRMRIAQEEIFGPVLATIPYDDVDDAVAVANDSAYGLAGSVWTADAEAGLGIARRVRTGTFGVNGYTMNFAAPFGGLKRSGFGRELGPEGLDPYLEYQSINLPDGLRS